MLNNKPSVLICTKYFPPLYEAGGGVKSIYNLVESLKEDINFTVISGDRLPNNDKTFEGLIVNKFTKYNSTR